MAFPANLTNAVDDVTEIVAAHLNNLEAKVGIDGSAVTASLDYLLKSTASLEPGHKHSKLWSSDGAMQAVTVDATGKVGIGTTEPVSKLSVSGGDLQVESGMGRFKGWYNAGSGLAAEIGTDSGQVYIDSFNRSDSTYHPLNIGGSTINLGHNNASDLFINSLGNIGIGTISPTSKLQVVGLSTYTNNTDALASGLTAGAFYRTGADPDPVCVVH